MSDFEKYKDFYNITDVILLLQVLILLHYFRRCLLCRKPESLTDINSTCI